MGIPLLDARKLAADNKTTHERLVSLAKAAHLFAEEAQNDLGVAYQEAFDTYLAPFADAFARIKNVELTDLPSLEAVPELKGMDVELRGVALGAVAGLTTLAGGGAAGAIAGAGAFTAVGALATASTGTAIAGLSGAAATSATLAWLGGGSLAAGGLGVAGGTVVLTGLVALPVVLAVGGFLHVRGKRAVRQQQEVREELKQAEHDLNVQLKRASLATARFMDTAAVVRELVAVGETRLHELRLLIERDHDYGRYSAVERALVAESAGLATAVAAVISCGILDEDGTVTSLSTDTLDAARAAARRLAA